MEFKGTNETWFLSVREIVSMPSQIKICKVAGKDFEEAKYNAKLISRAPEMLDFLIRLRDEWRHDDLKYGGESYHMKDITNLIKEATEL